MLRKSVYLFIVLTFILASNVMFAQPSLAQSDCSSAIIDDETSTLEMDSICKAAKQWSDKGISIYILYSQETFSNEDSWYDYLDEKETEIGQRQGTQIKKNFLAFEATSDGQWIAITQGDYLYYETPFDGQVDRLKGVLDNGILADNATQAFIDTLNDGFEIAFPVLIQQQVEKPQVIILTPQPAKEPIDWTPIIGVIKTVLIWIFSLGAGFALIYFAFIPGWKFGLMWYRKNKHLSAIKVKITKLLNSLGRLFEGINIEATLLFQLLESYGVKKYPKANEEVSEWLRRSKTALDESFRLLKLLESDKVEKKSIDKQIAAWETLYITLIGSNPDILTLNDQQIIQLLDPSADVDINSVDVKLVEQIRSITKELAVGGYKITFMVVKPEDVDQEGILGYVKQVKDQLIELRKAKAEATPKVNKAKEMLKNASAGPFPWNLTADKVFFKAKGLINEAEQNIATRSWLPAIRQAEDTMELITAGQQSLLKIVQSEEAINKAINKFETNDLLPEKYRLFDYPCNILTSSLRELVENDYIQAVTYANDLIKALQSLDDIVAIFLVAYKNHQSRMEMVEKISKKGFSLPFYQKTTAEIADDIKKIGDFLVKGDYQQTDAMIRELTRDSEALLIQSQALETIYEQNLNELKRLSTEVARVSEYNLLNATPAWNLLCGYPQANRADIIEIEIPIITLQNLFDDPTNASDLASEIAKLNSFEKQQFIKAQEELVVAFSRVQKAENQLKVIVERLNEVQKAEQESTKILEQIRKELENTTAKRDTYDKYVDKTVDHQIEQARETIDQIQNLIDRREYLEAMHLLLQARITLKTALSSIDEQSQQILSLLKELESSKTTTSKAVNQVVRDYANLIPVLKSSMAGTNVEKAVQALRQAQNANERLAGLEDYELKSVVEKVSVLYREALKSAQEANSRMEQDKDEYEKYHSNAQRAISNASQAIASARLIINNSDAESAGESAYRRAQQYLPDSISYGISISQLQQIEAKAEQSRQAALQAQSEVESHIETVEAERARRRRKEEENRRRKEEERHREDSYSSSSSSFGGSSRSSSSFGGSSRSSSSFGGSSRSSSSFGGSHRR